MLKKSLIILPLFFLGMASYTQVSSSDTTRKKEKVEDWVIDSTIDYDLLLQDMETFLDSISSPHSYLLGSFAMGTGYSTIPASQHHCLRQEEILPTYQLLDTIINPD